MIARSFISTQVPVCLALAASSAGAESFECSLDDGAEVRFSIDLSTFSNPVSKDEPMRRQVTLVEMNASEFPADPIVIGDMRGFAAEGFAGATIMFIVEPDGTARLSNTQSGIRIDGFCEVIQ